MMLLGREENGVNFSFCWFFEMKLKCFSIIITIRGLRRSTQIPDA